MKYAHQFLFPILYNKGLVNDSEILKWKSLELKLLFNYSLVDFLQSFGSLKALDDCFESIKYHLIHKWGIVSMDFWYDFLSGNFDDELGLRRNVENISQPLEKSEPSTEISELTEKSELSTSNLVNVTFSGIDKGKWIIKVDGDEKSNPIDPAKDSGINYILKLLRHKGDDIFTINLYNSVPPERHKNRVNTLTSNRNKIQANPKIDKKKKIPLTEDEKRRNSISGAIDTTFNNYIHQKNFRKIFRKHFRISSDVSRFIESIDDTTFKVKISE